MEEEIQGLSERIKRLLATVRRLSDENVRLRRQLGESKSVCAELQQRMTDARVRVEAALSRLPLIVDDEG
jgi:predicted  nucleic acid-binding Zn-ribbon protein